MDIAAVKTPNAPAAIGPYSQAIIVDNLVFASGQIGVHPATGELISSDVVEQTRQVINNLAEIIRAAGSSLDRVVKTTVYLTNMDDFGAMNGEYAKFFSGRHPARSTVQVARLPKGALVEIEAVAILDSK